MLVMQLEEVQVRHQASFPKPGLQPSWSLLRASLRNPSESSEKSVQAAPMAFGGILGQRVISVAAICPLFNGTSIFSILVLPPADLTLL